MFTALAATGVGITSEMLTPLTDAVTENLAVIIPVGITLMAIMIGVRLVPRIIHSFF